MRLEIGLILLIISLAISNGWFYRQKTIEENKNRTLTEVISTLKIEAELQKKRAEDARDTAEKKILLAQKEAEGIMAENVPSDCNEAVKWGIENAKSF